MMSTAYWPFNRGIRLWQFRFGHANYCRSYYSHVFVLWGGTYGLFFRWVIPWPIYGIMPWHKNLMSFNFTSAWIPMKSLQ